MSDLIVHALARFAHGADEGLERDVLRMLGIGRERGGIGEFRIEDQVVSGFQARLGQRAAGATAIALGVAIHLLGLTR